MAGLFFIIFIVGLIFYCLYKVHSKKVFNLYEPYCPSCDTVFDVEYTYYIACPNCNTKIIWRKKKRTQILIEKQFLKNLKKYREKRGRTK